MSKKAYFPKINQNVTAYEVFTLLKDGLISQDEKLYCCDPNCRVPLELFGLNDFLNKGVAPYQYYFRIKHNDEKHIDGCTEVKK